MTPHPGEDNLVSKAIFICALIVLLLILGACVFVIYGYLSPSDGTPATATPISTPIPTPIITVAPTPKPTPTPTTAPGTPTPTYTGVYQEDTRVTSGDFEFYYPGIWDHYIVYDMFDGAKNYTMLYDTVTRQNKQIDSGTVFSYGTISNGKVMLYYPLKGNKIYLYTITNGNNDLTSNDNNYARGSITMFDSKLAYYQDIGHYNTDGKWVPVYAIYVFSLVDGIAADVMDNIPKPLDIRIYGDRLVYTVVSGSGSDIYLLDLAQKTPKPQKISTGTGNNNHARIYDHIIVYHSDTEGKDHIYIYDINTGKTSLVTSEGEQWNADIYGNTIVYDDNRNGNWDIYAYDITTHTERMLTNEPHDQRSPVIYGNRIAYMDNRNGQQAIYTMTIS